MAAAVLTTATTLSATMSEIASSPPGTVTFDVPVESADRFYVLDDDTVFNDSIFDLNQVVAPKSTIFLDNIPVGSRHLFQLTPDNGDPSFIVSLIFEVTTLNVSDSPLNTLNYAIISVQPLQAGVIYSITGYTATADFNYTLLPGLLICFAGGTFIETPDGPRKVETLGPGDRVSTADHSAQPIRWIGSTRVRYGGGCDRLKPICIQAESLAPGVPSSDLVVSRQHRILLAGPHVETLFKAAEVLVPAFALTELPGVRIMHGKRQITFHHLLLDRHEIVLAQGARTESLYPGPTVMKHLATRQRNEILQCFPRLRLDPISGYGPTARRLLTPREGRKLVARIHAGSLPAGWRPSVMRDHASV